MHDLLLSYCPDGTCCCIPLRTAVALISILCLVGCVLDIWADDNEVNYEAKQTVDLESFKRFIADMFLLANVLLFLVAIVENAKLVYLYECYAMGFVVMGLGVTLVNFLRRFQTEGITSCYWFAAEVLYFFAIYGCLPVMDAYRSHLGDSSATN